MRFMKNWIFILPAQIQIKWPLALTHNTKYQYLNYYYFAAIKHADRRT